MTAGAATFGAAPSASRPASTAHWTCYERRPSDPACRAPGTRSQRVGIGVTELCRPSGCQPPVAACTMAKPSDGTVVARRSEMIHLASGTVCRDRRNPAQFGVPTPARHRARTLSGSIYDQTGAPLPGVAITIRGVTERRTHTNATGAFTFLELPEGDHEISAELSGFQPARRTVRVQAGERVTVSFTLHVAIVEETIVTAAKAGERNIQTLPMAITAVSNADFARLGTQTVGEAAALAPSVTFSQNTGFGQLTIRGIGANVLYAGADPSSAMYLDGVYLARPAMEFVQFLDLDRIEVLRGPQGTLYGRNAVGGAINLISKPPTNDFEAAADFTAGNFGALRVDARASGPLKRDRVMGTLAFARGVRDGYVHDLEHPDHPLGGDDVTAARGQLRVVFDRRTNLLVSSDVDHQGGTPLTFNKVLAVKPGFQVDNPPDLHDVRASALAWNRTLHSGASARLTMALTPSTTLVSLTAFRTLDFEFFVDADMTELDLVTSHQHERQHQLSEEITISHQQPRLTWVAGVFLFDEPDHQTFWVDQPAARFQVRLDPRVDATSRAVFGQATVGLTSRLSATAGVRYTHEGKDIDNAGGRYSLDTPDLAVPGFGLRLFRFHRAQRLDAQSRPRDEAAARRAHVRVGDTRVQERRVQPVVNGGGPRLRSGVGVELRRRMEEHAHGRPFQARRVRLRHGLHEPAGADAHRDWGLRHPKCRSRDYSRRRSGEHVTDRARR